MKSIIEKDYCTGCGACVASCPKNAIITYFDSEGFEYPRINPSLCIDCGLCQRICPPLHFSEYFETVKNHCTVQRGFAARSNNLEERLTSSSGGIFPLLAREIIEEKGLVVGVGFDSSFGASYQIIEEIDQLPIIQGSKYMQCKIDSTVFKRVKEALIAGRKVLFSGFACQCEGLKNYLTKDYKNLFCVDLICMGVPSRVVWQHYLKTFFNNEEIHHINFKEKSLGWNRFSLSIQTDKQAFLQRGALNPFFRSMFKGYNMRRSCFFCTFKKRERTADITLADCWGVYDLAPLVDDNKGLSAVLIHTEKGRELWSRINSKTDFVERPFEVFVKGNPNMIERKSVDYKSRSRFYSYLNSNNEKKAFEYAGKDRLNIKALAKQLFATLFKH